MRINVITQSIFFDLVKMASKNYMRSLFLLSPFTVFAYFAVNMILVFLLRAFQPSLISYFIFSVFFVLFLSKYFLISYRSILEGNFNIELSINKNSKFLSLSYYVYFIKSFFYIIKSNRGIRYIFYSTILCFIIFNILYILNYYNEKKSISSYSSFYMFSAFFYFFGLYISLKKGKNIFILASFILNLLNINIINNDVSKNEIKENAVFGFVKSVNYATVLLFLFTLCILVPSIGDSLVLFVSTYIIEEMEYKNIFYINIIYGFIGSFLSLPLVLFVYSLLFNMVVFSFKDYFPKKEEEVKVGLPLPQN